LHQLVLHGIGGRTIAEAKRNLTWIEVQRWIKFMELRGSLDWGFRMEKGFALLAYLIANKSTFVDAKGNIHGAMKKQGGHKFELRDFFPHAGPEEEERDFTPDDVLAAFGKQGKKT
jgi:hypothetical protein